MKAIVSPKAGRHIEPASIIQWTRDRIAGYKAPKSVDVVQSLPCNATGKINKQELRKNYWPSAGRDIN
ncbi:hypothetical protein H5J25_02305 [Sphingomonas aliaeris]|uniref:AMP-binding enzyme C-terminal domain-containing protein n=1 Tax=Sphingomonas aliaeris TaxID=2759526 RepID=A0A974NV77_9SPHN|nr:hypothetical protein H5J25_02305 [Sphingomonas aliaeris]